MNAQIPCKITSSTSESSEPPVLPKNSKSHCNVQMNHSDQRLFTGLRGEVSDVFVAVLQEMRDGDGAVDESCAEHHEHAEAYVHVMAAQLH